MDQKPDRGERKPRIDIDNPFSCEVKAAPCPSCGKELDGCTSFTGQQTPSGGDFSVCLYCSTILRFTAGLGLSSASTSDLVELMVDQPEMFTLLAKIQTATQLCRAEKAKGK